jgi:YHS domain-containing protein
VYLSTFENAFLMQNTCAECGDSFKGRSDKKFCSDACRNTFNNRENNYTNNTIKRINHILRKNRKILEQLNPEGKASVPGKRLRDLGFDFDYFTHVYRTKKGTIYYFCYEQGYLAIDADFYTLVRREED